MHGASPPLSTPLSLLSLTTVSVGLEGGFRWLPGYLHRHSKFHCHCTKPSDLQECDIANSIAGRCRCHKRCLLTIWVDPTGAFVGNRVRPMNELLIWAAVHGYPSPGKEWHRTLYTNRACLSLTPLSIVQFKISRSRLHCILL